MGKLNSEKHGNRIEINIESKSGFEEHCDDLLQFLQFKKKNHGRVLLLVKLQAGACSSTKSNTPQGGHFHIF